MPDALFMLLAAIACCIIYVRMSGIVYLGRTMAGPTLVHDDHHVMGERIRVLEVRRTYQSATYLDEDTWCDLPFMYLRLYDRLFDLMPGAHDLLMLGGGGFAYPKHIVAHRPEARIDVVEVDSAMTRIAYEFFFLDRLIGAYHTRETGRLRIYHTDAVTYLRACLRKGKRYDAILNDCFELQTPSPALFSVDALSAVRSCLVPGGLYLVNVITALEGELAGPLLRLTASLSEVFEHVYALPCYREPTDRRDNVIVISSQRPLDVAGGLTLFEGVT